MRNFTFYNRKTRKIWNFEKIHNDSNNVLRCKSDDTNIELLIKAEKEVLGFSPIIYHWAL